MRLFKIVKDTNPNLRKRCKEVSLPISEEIVNTLKDMNEYLKFSQDEEFLKNHPDIREGVGLAAPQAGLDLRMLTIYYQDKNEKGEVIKTVSRSLINPKIIASSLKLCCLSGGEGCLSVDEKHEGLTYRAYRITVKAINGETLKEEEFDAVGFESIVLQHEIDHLNGVLFYDHFNDKVDPMMAETAIKI